MHLEQEIFIKINVSFNSNKNLKKHSNSLFRYPAQFFNDTLFTVFY